MLGSWCYTHYLHYCCTNWRERMNEKIKQLALDAGIGFTLWDDSGREMIDNYTPEEHLAEFALLIVQECGKVIVNGGYRNPALGEKLPLTPPEIAQMIKEHFGVEE